MKRDPVGKYILDGHTPVPEPDTLKWARWFEDNGATRHVADTQIAGIRISTVFLALDHSFSDGPPELFETMIFGGKLSEQQRRYTTWGQAAAGHRAMCRRVVRSITENLMTERSNNGASVSVDE